MARRLKNKARTKVPHRVWMVTWGYRDSDPAVTWILSLDKFPTKGKVLDRIDEMLHTWIKEEADFYEEDYDTIADQTAVYGPFLESYIRTVKELRPAERKEIETDFGFYGEAFIPRE